jgi:hypothetical protein
MIEIVSHIEKKKKNHQFFFGNGNYCKIGENMKLKQGCNIKKWG